MIVNGKTEDPELLNKLRTLMDLVKYYNLNPEAVAVERNGEIPPREEWNRILLSQEDRIELIRFVGGG